MPAHFDLRFAEKRAQLVAPLDQEGIGADDRASRNLPYIKRLREEVERSAYTGCASAQAGLEIPI